MTKKTDAVQIEHCPHCTLAKAVLKGYPRKGTK